MKVTQRDIELAEALQPVFDLIKDKYDEEYPHVVLFGMCASALLLHGAAAEDLHAAIDSLVNTLATDPPEMPEA